MEQYVWQSKWPLDLTIHSGFKQLKDFNRIYKFLRSSQFCIKYFNIQVYLLLGLFLYLLKDSFNDQELIIGIFNTKGCHWEMLVSPVRFYSLILLSLQNLHLLRLH